MTHTTIHDPTADAFMRRILANPVDALPRLVFADWLDETGIAANMAWARYLRLADEIATASEDDPRLRKLNIELDRVSGLVRARLRYSAQIFVAYPEAMLSVLPAKNMDLNVEHVQVPMAVRELLPESVAREHVVLPLALLGNRLAIAYGGPRDPALTLQALRFILNREILTFRVAEEHARAALAANYGNYEVESVDSPFYIFLTRIVEAARALEGAEPHAVENRITDCVTAILTDAAEYDVTTLEIVPTENDLQIRWPGAQYDLVAALNRQYLVPLVTQFRALARIPSGNTDAIQFGHIEFPFRDRLYHFGVRITMTAHGPQVVLSLRRPPPESAALPTAA